LKVASVLERRSYCSVDNAYQDLLTCLGIINLVSSTRHPQLFLDNQTRPSRMSERSHQAAKVFPCDQCLHRKIRCDKSLPCCDRCSESSLRCTREIVRRRPGRKKGSGTVISRLKTAPEGVLNETREFPDGRLISLTPESATPGPSIVERQSLRAVNDDDYFTGPPRVPRRRSTPYGSPTSSVPGTPRVRSSQYIV
jgi:hypothetical protein